MAGLLAALPLIALDADAKRANNLGAVYLSSARVDDAGEQFRYAYNHIPKEDSRTLAAILCNLGAFAVMKGRHSEAERHLTGAIEMSRRLLRSHGSPTDERESEINLTGALANLGECYRRQQRPEEAERVTRNALELKERLYGAGSLELTGVLNSLGLSEYDQKKFDQAEQTLKRSLAIREAHSPANDPAIAITLANLSAVWISKGDLISADDGIHRALEILEARHGRFHAALVPILLVRAELYRAKAAFLPPRGRWCAPCRFQTVTSPATGWRIYIAPKAAPRSPARSMRGALLLRR